MSETIELPVSTRMTPGELFAHHDALMKLLSTDAYVSISIGGWSFSEPVASIGIWPEGMGTGKSPHYIKGNDWPTMIAEAYQWIENSKVVRRDSTVLRMALAIIELTDTHGTCTAVTLERKSFSKKDIRSYHKAACQRAGEMCAGAPFSVIFDASSQDASAPL